MRCGSGVDTTKFPFSRPEALLQENLHGPVRAMRFESVSSGRRLSTLAKPPRRGSTGSCRPGQDVTFGPSLDWATRLRLNSKPLKAFAARFPPSIWLI